MINYKKMCIDQHCKIQDAIKKLNENSIKTLFVVDNDFNLKGSITDGDIRRSLIREFSMETNVTSFMNPSPKYCLLSDNELKIKATMEKNSVETLPILNKNFEICGVRVNSENDNRDNYDNDDNDNNNDYENDIENKVNSDKKKSGFIEKQIVNRFKNLFYYYTN